MTRYFPLAFDRSSSRLTQLKVLALAALTIAAAQLFAAANVGLSNDEAYYRTWSLYWALSYYDHPPMTAWFIAGGRWFGGDNTLGVRLASPLTYIAAGIALFRTADVLYDRQTAVLTCWIALAMPLLALGGVLAGPDVPSVLFSVLTVWALAELNRTQNPSWWIVVGISAGCGLLSKYTNLFLGVPVLAWVLSSPSNRQWVRSPYFWLAGLIALMLACPVLVWNAKHSWLSFSKQFGRVTTSSPRPHHFALEMVGSFFALTSPGIAILTLVGVWRVARSAYRNWRPADVIVSTAVLPAIGYFCLHSLHDRVHGNWAAPFYPFLAICAARSLLTVQEVNRRQKAFAGSVGMGLLATAIIFVHALHPLTGSRPDPLEEIRGWSSLAEAANGSRQKHGADWIGTLSFRTTSQLKFALKDRVEVIQLNESYRYLDSPSIPRGLLASHGLVVESEADASPTELRALFGRVEELEPLHRYTGLSRPAIYRVYLVWEPRFEGLALSASPQPSQSSCRRLSRVFSRRVHQVRPSNDVFLEASRAGSLKDTRCPGDNDG